jgi:biopolymer transport protein ExbB/TolQ
MKASTMFTLFIIITLGVTVGNLTSNYITARVTAIVLEREARAIAKQIERETQQLNEQLRIDSERRRKQLAEQQTQNKVRFEAERREREKQEEIRRKLQSTCDFWQREFNNTGKELDKIHRDNACKAVR